MSKYYKFFGIATALGLAITVALWAAPQDPRGPEGARRPKSPQPVDDPVTLGAAPQPVEVCAGSKSGDEPGDPGGGNVAAPDPNLTVPPSTIFPTAQCLTTADGTAGGQASVQSINPPRLAVPLTTP